MVGLFFFTIIEDVILIMCTLVPSPFLNFGTGNAVTIQYKRL